MDLFFISTSFYNARKNNFEKIKKNFLCFKTFLKNYYFSKVLNSKNRCDFDHAKGVKHPSDYAICTIKIGEMQLFKIKSFCRKFFKKNLKKVLTNG